MPIAINSILLVSPLSLVSHEALRPRKRFLVVIIMLNVLIAVVSDSYDGAMIKSRRIHHRARLESIAEIDAFITDMKQLKYFKHVTIFVGGTIWLYAGLCFVGVSYPS